MPASHAHHVLATQCSRATLIAVLLLGGPAACGGGSDEGSGGSSGSAGTGASGGSSGAAGGSGGSSGSSAGTSGTGGNAEPSGEMCANDQRAGSLSLRLSGGDRTLVD